MQVIQLGGKNSLEYIFDNERPIYLQLVEFIKIGIVSGEFKLGEKIPSVREFACMVKVNPNTMQKALIELEREKLIYTERTNGKYITNDEKIIMTLKKDIVNEKIETFLSDMKNIGISNIELIEYLKNKEREDE